MGEIVLFDTLKYASILRKNSIDGADHLANALAGALKENLYSKSEVEKMIEQALKEFREGNVLLKDELRQVMDRISAESRQADEASRDQTHKLLEKMQEQREADVEKTNRLIDEMRLQRETDQEYFRKSREEFLREIHDVSSKLMKFVAWMTALIASLIPIVGAIFHFLK